MTTGSTSLSLQLRITGITGGSFQAHTRQNVKKRIENIVYLEEPPADAVKISYVGSNELSATENLFLGDRSDGIYANARTGTIQELVGAAQPVSVRNRNFIVTQEFNEADSRSIPLYYKHILSTDIVPESVRVYNQDFEPVSIDKYKLQIQQTYDEDTGLPESPADYIEYHLYNNLESSYDHDTGEYTVYFVQYTELVSGVETAYTELLSNEVAYTEAAVGDIWGLTLELKPWVKAYMWDESTLSIKLPTGSEYAVRYEETKRIKVRPPSALTDTSPWFTRVINGNFKWGYRGETFTYSIPEFSNQAFNPIEPYKLAAGTTCTKIDTYLIKLPHEDIQSGSMFSYLDLTADIDGAIEYAITNDPTKAGNEYRDFDNQRVLDSNGDTVLWSSADLLGIDHLAGIVNVGFKVLDSYSLYASYSYEESNYELTSLNMNPVFDSDAQKQLRAIYLVPESLANDNLAIQTEAIKWLKVAPSGLIESTNQDGIGGNEDISSSVALETTSGYRLTGVAGMHYNWDATATSSRYQEVIESGNLRISSTSTFPNSGWVRFQDTATIPKIRYAKFDSKTDTALVLSSDATEVADSAFVNSGTTIELVNFINERTNLSNRDGDTEDATLGSGTFPVSSSRYFVLSEMTINPPHGVKNTVQIDVREDGGGINAERYEAAKLLNPQAQWLTNFGNFEGQVYPGKAVMVVKLPVSILEQFTEDQVKRIVEQNVPYGIQPLIRYYGYKPNLSLVEITTIDYTYYGFGFGPFGETIFGGTGATPADQISLTVTWDKMGDEFTYEVWYAKTKNGPWIRHHDFRLTDTVVDFLRGGGITGSAPYQTYPQNVYVVDGLEANTRYSIKVTCSDKYYQWWYSYGSPGGLQGGLSEPSGRPSPNDGNIVGLQFEI